MTPRTLYTHPCWHACDAMGSFLRISVCSSCVEWAHVVVGWYFILCFCLTHTRIVHTCACTHAHRGVMSLSARLPALSLNMHLLLPRFSFHSLESLCHGFPWCSVYSLRWRLWHRGTARQLSEAEKVKIKDRVTASCFAFSLRTTRSASIQSLCIC